MCMIFRMEDLVASAFIGLLKNGNITNRKISVRQLVEYRKNVIRALNEINKTAVIPISRDYTAKFLYFFDDYFSYEENEKAEDYICLHNEKTQEDLQNEFGIFIPYDVRSCFSDEKNLAPILSGVG